VLGIDRVRYQLKVSYLGASGFGTTSRSVTVRVK
jgi:hypothetical protein